MVMSLRLCRAEIFLNRMAGFQARIKSSNGLESANCCRSRTAAFGPECVKTLSYRACFSPLLLSMAISRLFTAISAGNASERV